LTVPDIQSITQSINQGFTSVSSSEDDVRDVSYNICTLSCVHSTQLDVRDALITVRAAVRTVRAALITVGTAVRTVRAALITVGTAVRTVISFVRTAKAVLRAVRSVVITVVLEH
jgi:hypothetical protein